LRCYRQKDNTETRQDLKKYLGDDMKLKTKIRAGKIRPNHNVSVHRTAELAQTFESTEVVTLTASTSAR